MPKLLLYDILILYDCTHFPRARNYMEQKQIERWYSMNEISEYLGITRDTTLAWIEKRGMPGVKIGRTWKFKISEVDAWMKSNENITSASKGVKTR